MNTLTVKSGRQYNLDWLRVIVVLILIPFHAAVSFSHIGKGYVYADAASQSMLFIFISDFFNLWIMRLLFFVSGVSVFFALKKRSSAQFAADRFKRLIIPVIFLLLTIGPLSGYILAISRDGFSGTFFNYYPQFFIQPQRYLFWGHLWYCIYLFIFSIAFLPVFNFLLTRQSFLDKINSFLTRKNNIMLPMAVIMIFEILLRPDYPGYQSFIGDWANVAVHSSFFIFGFIMAKSSEVFDVITQKTKLLIISALVSTVLYLFLKRYPFAEVPQLRIEILSALWGAAAYTWVLGLVGLSRKYLSMNNRILKYLSKTSFSLYLFHYWIVSVLNYFLLKTVLPDTAVWFFTTAGTYIVFFIMFELVLKRIKLLRFICIIEHGADRKCKAESCLD